MWLKIIDPCGCCCGSLEGRYRAKYEDQGAVDVIQAVQALAPKSPTRLLISVRLRSIISYIARSGCIWLRQINVLPIFWHKEATPEGVMV